MALPLLFFPFSILSALSSLLMPEIARAHARRDHAAAVRLIRVTLRSAGLFSMLAGCCFVLFGAPVALLLYGDEQVAVFIRVLGFVAPFMYLESMVDGLLKGLGETAGHLPVFACWIPRCASSALWYFCRDLASPHFWPSWRVPICSPSGLNTARLLQRAQMPTELFSWLGRPLLFALASGTAGQAVLLAAGTRLPGLLAAGITVCGVFGLLAVLFGGLPLPGKGKKPQDAILTNPTTAV